MLARLVFILTLLSTPAFALDASVVDPEFNLTSTYSGGVFQLYGVTGRVDDLVITIKGPPQNLRLTQMEQHYGLWLPQQQKQVYQAPAFYIIANAANREPAKPFERPTFEITPKLEEHAYTILARQAQAQGVLDLRIGAVERLGPSLFRFRQALPPRLPAGNYNVEIFGLRGNSIIYKERLSFEVQRRGLVAQLYELAHAHPIAYAVLAVLIAGMIGVLSQWSRQHIRIEFR